MFECDMAIKIFISTSEPFGKLRTKEQNGSTLRFNYDWFFRCCHNGKVKIGIDIMNNEKTRK